MMRYVIVILLGIFTLFLLPAKSWCLDNLFLCGKIKKVYNNIVIIDVFSETCTGIHRFEVKNSKEKLEFFKNNLNKKVCFFITSDTCNVDETLIIDNKP